MQYIFTIFFILKSAMTLQIYNFTATYFYINATKRKKLLQLKELRINKQLLLYKIFVISRIIKAEVSAISRTWRMRWITLTKNLIILDITKTESSNSLITHWTKKNDSHDSAFSLAASNKACKLAMSTPGNHALWWYTTWLSVTLNVLDLIVIV